MRHRLMCVLRADGTRHARTRTGHACVCVTGLRGRADGGCEQARVRGRANDATVPRAFMYVEWGGCVVCMCVGVRC
eukprot:7290873-Prymnesium_polylepis.1